MTVKVWGGILVGIFVVAAGAELLRRKCPWLAKKVPERTKKILDSTGERIKVFAVSARDAFRNGYTSAKTELSKS